MVSTWTANGKSNSLRSIKKNSKWQTFVELVIFTYKKVVYSNYEYALTDEGAIIRPTESEQVINPQEDYDLTGEALLVELCNLARDINKYDVDNTLPAEKKHQRCSKKRIR